MVAHKLILQSGGGGWGRNPGIMGTGSIQEVGEEGVGGGIS